MGTLAIRQVHYSGDRYHFTSPEFGPGLSIIEGPNGSGKTTFFNLIYFGLGGRVQEFEKTYLNAHKEIAGDTNNLVSLTIAVNQKSYSVSRRIGANSISVSPISADIGEQSETYAVYRREDQRTFSDWLLSELEIPVVDITQGNRTFKLNFPDLARLIFHNQSPDPHGVFKPADIVTNYISDSLEVRRAIFEVLMGKALLALYQAMARLKKAERDREAAKLVLKEYTDIVDHISRSSGIKGVVNSTHLMSRIAELNEQMFKLTAERAALLSGVVRGNEAVASVEISKREFELAMQRRGDLDARQQELFGEKARLDEVRFVLRDDISRIEKILFTHKQLKLFSADTCPYCLSTVERVTGKCVCGGPIDESQYQRFFYSASEYLEILTSKTKSLQTLDQAGRDIRVEIESVSKELTSASEELQRQRAKFSETAGKASESWSPDERLDQVQDKLMEVRDQIGDLEQALRFEKKLAEFQRSLNTAQQAVEDARVEVDKHGAAAQQELIGRLRDFDTTYAALMQEVLQDCRDARLDKDTYLPVINNGEYREASADVTKRFLYYLTLLTLAVEKAIPHPRLLLVDTPETAGIDRENLIKNFRQISRIPDATSYQILLSTGEGKFPDEYKDRVRLRLSKNAKLLQENISHPRA